MLLSVGINQPLPRPIPGNDLSLLKHSLGCLLLLIGRIAVFAQDAFHHHTQFGADSFPYCPINRCVVTHSLYKFTSNGFECVIPQHFDCTVVDFERIVEGDFVFNTFANDWLETGCKTG
jgi:hypothetical protein